VTVPKTAVNKNHFPVPGKNHIRFSRQSRDVKPIAKAHAVNQAADDQLRLRIAS
jgi:hypothetical protein